MKLITEEQVEIPTSFWKKKKKKPVTDSSP